MVLRFFDKAFLKNRIQRAAVKEKAIVKEILNAMLTKHPDDVEITIRSTKNEVKKTERSQPDYFGRLRKLCGGKNIISSKLILYLLKRFKI